MRRGSTGSSGRSSRSSGLSPRALVLEATVLDDIRVPAALDWPAGPLLRVRVRATSEGSAKPAELAKAIGVWGADDLRAEHALVARLGVVAAVPVSVATPKADPAMLREIL